MWGWVGEILKSLVGPIFEAFRQWRAERTARSLGRAEQAAEDAKAGLKEAKDAQQARSSVGGSDSDVDRFLRTPADRARDQ